MVFNLLKEALRYLIFLKSEISGTLVKLHRERLIVVMESFLDDSRICIIFFCRINARESLSFFHT